MTDIDVAALRAAAEGATPGAWDRVTDDHGRKGLDHSVWSAAGECYVVERLAGPDAAHIAAANPAVVLALLDRLAVAEGAVERAASFDLARLNFGECPQCHQEKFIGHGPLCLDCFANTPNTEEQP